MSETFSNILQQPSHCGKSAWPQSCVYPGSRHSEAAHSGATVIVAGDGRRRNCLSNVDLRCFSNGVAEIHLFVGSRPVRHDPLQNENDWFNAAQCLILQHLQTSHRI